MKAIRLDSSSAELTALLTPVEEFDQPMPRHIRQHKLLVDTASHNAAAQRDPNFRVEWHEDGSVREDSPSGGFRTVRIIGYRIDLAVRVARMFNDRVLGGVA